MRRAPLKFQLLLLATMLLSSLNSQAKSDYRFGVALGLGGAGVSEPATVNGATTVVQRSEGPGTIDIWVDWLRTDTKTFAIEHMRGFRLGPFSSGVSFTGIAQRWYFGGAAPSAVEGEPGESTLLVQRYVPFLGLAAGVALADVNRPGETVPTSTGSGVYVGFKAGADYPLGLGRGLRPEIAYGMTISQSPTDPSLLNFFSIQCGWYFYL